VRCSRVLHGPSSGVGWRCPSVDYVSFAEINRSTRMELIDTGQVRQKCRKLLSAMRLHRFLPGGFDHVCMLEEPASIQIKVWSRDPHKLDSTRGCLPRFIIIPRPPRYQLQSRTVERNFGTAPESPWSSLRSFRKFLSVELEYHLAVSSLRLPSASTPLQPFLQQTGCEVSIHYR
jgi:hypothetical protein